MDTPPPLPDVPKAVPGIAQSLALCALFLFVSVAVAAPLELAKKFAGLPVDMFTSVLLQQIVAWPVALWAGHRWAKVAYHDTCPLTRFPLRNVPALLIAVFGASILLNELTTLLPQPELLRRVLVQGRLESSPLAFFLATVVLAPLGEELFFRGLVLRCYRARYSTSKAIWASAILFAAFHLNPWQAVGALPIGLWSAWLVVRTGSLLPGILVHVTVNVTDLYLLTPFIKAFGYTAEEVEAMTNQPAAAISLGVVLAVGAGLLHWRQFPVRTLGLTAPTSQTL